MKKNSCSGFTLIELIVVLVIVGLLSGLVMPRMFQSMTRIELRKAAGDMVSFLRSARDEAYYKKLFIRVSFNPDTRQVLLFRYQRASEDEETSFAGPEMVWALLKEILLPESVSIERIEKKKDTDSIDVHSLYFYPSGTSDGGVITLMDKKGRVFQISIDRITGKVRIIDDTENR
ncbi:prepilin-type N-terminal cleavage/methylation domain-containing protein [uncultured Desulfobacter sp.]|uniref:prepilin-type N-terminal cleavage/methylation domain-containing protein n=1 Tax=uncultured Desulfobacter sp. TaxID=240139 RepID=UPI002AAB5795|nr:prepilin-type N-terminal cleavage/methylation domain-containing protein [uncultured Desulfobacter sp.]